MQCNNVVSLQSEHSKETATSMQYTKAKHHTTHVEGVTVIGGTQRMLQHRIKQAVRVATRYAPAPLLPVAPQRLARRRADAT